MLGKPLFHPAVGWYHPASSPQSAEWPCWYYGPHGEAQIFERMEDVPVGWKKSPKEFTVRPENAPVERTDGLRHLDNPDIAGQVPEGIADIPPVKEFDRDAAINELQAKGVKVDGRWSDKRIQEVLAAA